MKLSRIVCILIVSWLLAGCSEGGAESGAPAFDFYVLSLSWSASYCEAEGDAADPQQCGTDAYKGFVLHGLWPQYEQGYPEFCSMIDDGHFQQGELAPLRELFPSSAMIRHQWRKHGSCTAMSREDYFAAVREARDRVDIPALLSQAQATQTLAPNRIEAAFRQANPGLTADAIAVTCRDGRLHDVRICMTREFRFRACPEIDQRGCRRRSIRLPAGQSE